VYILSLVERLSLCWRQTLSSWAIMEPAMEVTWHKLHHISEIQGTGRGSQL